MRNYGRSAYFKYRMGPKTGFEMASMHYHNLLQFHNLQMIMVEAYAGIQSDIEPKHDNIAILDFIGLALQPDGSVFARDGIAAGFH